MARMKNVVRRNWIGKPLVARWGTHVHKYHKKKPVVNVPILITEWIEKKPGANSWIKRKEK